MMSDVCIDKTFEQISSRCEFLFSYCTSVFGHHSGVETLRLLESDGQRGATAHAQTHHRRGLRGTWARAKRLINTNDCK